MKTVLLECGHTVDAPDCVDAGNVTACDKCTPPDSAPGVNRKIVGVICQMLGSLTPDDYEEVLSEHRRLVRYLDVLINGEEGAARQASLCDLVGQIAKMLASNELSRREKLPPLYDAPLCCEAKRTEHGTWMQGTGRSVACEIAFDAMRAVGIRSDNDWQRGSIILAISDRVNGTLDYVSQSQNADPTVIKNIEALLEKWKAEDDLVWRVVLENLDDKTMNAAYDIRAAISSRRSELVNAVTP